MGDTPMLTSDNQRHLPHNIDAEQALLGAVLVKGEVLDRIPADFTADHFYDGLHGRIFIAMKGLHAHGRAITPTLLAGYFEKEFVAEPLVAADGTVMSDGLSVKDYVIKLALAATTTMSAPDYARAVRNLAVRRQLITWAETMMEAALTTSPDDPVDEQIERAESSLFAISQGTASEGAQISIEKGGKEALEHANKAARSNTGMVGISTGLTDLDNRLGGISETSLVIVAGRPGSGKSALATNIAIHRARHGDFVHVFSMEMSAMELANRVIGDHAGISSHDLRRGKASEDDFRKAMRAAEGLKALDILIDESGGLTIAQLAARARRMKRLRKTKLIVVDYLQLMRGTKRDSNRVAEVTEITVGLKALAKELHTPIIALSQLSRKVEERENKRPQLSDLRESGSIEQDADAVLFVYREEYYVEQKRPADGDAVATANWERELAACAGKAEIIIGKQRHGPTGIVPVAFEGRFTRFSNLAHGGVR